VTLLLLGRNPLRRSLAYVLGWTLANVLAVTLLMLVGTEFAISLEHGAREQVLIDLLGAGGRTLAEMDAPFGIGPPVDLRGCQRRHQYQGQKQRSHVPSHERCGVQRLAGCATGCASL